MKKNGLPAFEDLVLGPFDGCDMLSHHTEAVKRLTRHIFYLYLLR